VIAHTGTLCRLCSLPTTISILRIVEVLPSIRLVHQATICPYSTYWASPTLRPHRAAPTPNSSSCAGSSSWKSGEGCTRPSKIRLSPLAKAPSVHGPLQVRRWSPTSDEIWEELPPRPSFLGRLWPDHLPQLCEGPENLRARHPPLSSQEAGQRPPPSGGHCAGPRRAGLVPTCPPRCSHPVYKIPHHGLPPLHVLSPVVFRRFNFFPLN